MTSLPWISIPTVALFFAEVRGYSKLFDNVSDCPLGKLKNDIIIYQLFCNLVVCMSLDWNTELTDLLVVTTWSMCFQVGLVSSWVWSPSCFSLTCVSTGFIGSYIISLFTRWAQMVFLFELCIFINTPVWQYYFGPNHIHFCYNTITLTICQYDCINLIPPPV